MGDQVDYLLILYRLHFDNEYYKTQILQILQILQMKSKTQMSNTTKQSDSP
jgi:hypothetical protein